MIDKVFRSTSKRFRKSLLHTRQASNLHESDSVLYELLQREKQRQRQTINLIASENYASKAVLQALASTASPRGWLSNDGQNEAGSANLIDEVCRRRALNAFKLHDTEWQVSIHAFSGTAANLSVYAALLRPSHGRICGLSPNHGGHGSHGDAVHRRTAESFTSAAFQTIPYFMDIETGEINYDLIQPAVDLFRPQLLIAGFSCGTTRINWSRMKSLARRCGALLMADVAHVGGLIAGAAYPTPFAHADIVTMTTHKTLRGPRGSLIFYRRSLDSQRDSFGWHPNFQGNLRVIDDYVRRTTLEAHGASANHRNAVSCALREAATPNFSKYALQTVHNAQHLEAALRARGQTTFARGTKTQTHIVLWDLRDAAIPFDTMLLQTLLDFIGLNANAYCVPNKDAASWITNGMRLGTAALTSRDVRDADLELVADMLVETRGILHEMLTKKPGLTLDGLTASIASDLNLQRCLDSLKSRVTDFASRFPLPGCDEV